MRWVVIELPGEPARKTLSCESEKRTEPAGRIIGPRATLNRREAECVEERKCRSLCRVFFERFKACLSGLFEPLKGQLGISSQPEVEGSPGLLESASGPFKVSELLINPLDTILRRRYPSAAAQQRIRCLLSYFV